MLIYFVYMWSGVWVPAIPSWEKEFCYKMGSFNTWKDFLNAKEQTRYADKILEWDDSAAEDAFINAKKLFFARINNDDHHHHDSPLHDPDLYTDQISWDDDPDDDDQVKSELLRELESAAAARKCEDEHDEEVCRIEIQDIKATGWEQEQVYFATDKCKTGLIVGR